MMFFLIDLCVILTATANLEANLAKTRTWLDDSRSTRPLHTVQLVEVSAACPLAIHGE